MVVVVVLVVQVSTVSCEGGGAYGLTLELSSYLPVAVDVVDVSVKYQIFTNNELHGMLLC